MPKYQVRVWISDIEVIANNREEAEIMADDIVGEELNCAYVEFAEAQKIFTNGEWKYLGSGEDGH